MKIIYEEGPDEIKAGIAGQFKRGEPKEVVNEVAECLLKKTSIKFKKFEDIKSSRKKEE